MADQQQIWTDALAAATPLAGVAGVAAMAAEAGALIAASSHTGGGSYQFSPTELASVLKQWQDLQKTVEQAMTSTFTTVDTTAISSVVTGNNALAPGNETASDAFAQAATASTQAYQDYLTSMNNYVQGYVNSLSAALKHYNETEHTNASSARSVQADL